MVLFNDIPNNLGPFEWFLKWLPSIGWPVIILISWKAHSFFTEWEKKAEDLFTTVNDSAKQVKINTDDIKEFTGYILKFKEVFDLHMKQDDEHFRTLRENVAAHIAVTTSSQMGIEKLADAIHHQSEVHSAQLGVLREIAEKQAVLASNQVNITSGFQRVVEQLISMMKDG